MRRVLIVEQIAQDRFHRGLTLPFLRGWLEERGIGSIRWLRFARRAGERLSPEDLESLGAVAAELRPTHLVFSPTPTGAMLRSIATLDPPPALGALDDLDPAERATRVDDIERLEADGRRLSAFFGLPQLIEEKGHIFDQVTPHFGWEPGNRAAAEAPPLPFLVCGPECSYSRPVASAEPFVNLSLPEEVSQRGCSFCTAGLDQGRQWTTDAATLLRRQLEALLRTHRSWSDHLAVRAVGEPALRQLEYAAESLIELDLPPLSLVLDSRADGILRHRQRLARALERLRTTDHQIQLGLVGIESFVARELELFNKGTSWRDNLEAIKTLQQLEAEYPEHFDFHEHGGLSLILQTPWTRPQDLALNLSVLSTARLGPLCGKTLTSRLRLTPPVALHALAERDGLLVERYDDPALDTARRNDYPAEVPWRFRDPLMAAIGSLLPRLEPDEVFGEPRLRPLLERAGSPLVAARALVDAALFRRSTDQKTLLATAEAMARSVRGRRIGPRALESPACCREAADGESSTWALIALRLEVDGPLAPLLNPGPLSPVAHRPCSEACEQALLDSAAERLDRKQHRSLQNPWLVLPEEEAAVELRIDLDSRGPHHYQLGQRRDGHHLLLEVLEAGDQLDIDEQRIEVLRRGEVIGALGGRAFLWWHCRPVQAELWRSLLAIRRAEPRTERSEVGEARALTERLARLLRAILTPSRGEPPRFSGARVVEVCPRGDELRLSLSLGGHELTLGAAARQRGRRGLATAGPLVFFWVGEGADQAKEVVEELARYVSGRIEKR